MFHFSLRNLFLFITYCAIVAAVGAVSWIAAVLVAVMIVTIARRTYYVGRNSAPDGAAARVAHWMLQVLLSAGEEIVQASVACAIGGFVFGVCFLVAHKSSLLKGSYLAGLPWVGVLVGQVLYASIHQWRLRSIQIHKRPAPIGRTNPSDRP